jgi:transcriptional/translational regulatory protein YebC/TACO1
MGTPGSVAYQFQQKGLVTTNKNGMSIDDIFLIAADSGAEDVEDLGDEVYIYTRTENLAKVRDGLQAKGLAVKVSELIRQPMVTTTITDVEAAKRITSFIEKLEEMDDVQKVYANFDIPDTVLAVMQ